MENRTKAKLEGKEGGGEKERRGWRKRKRFKGERETCRKG